MNSLKISPPHSENSEKNKSNNSVIRLSYIDRAKGVAILLVVFGHVFCNMGYPDDESRMHLLSYQFVATFHMPLFFFLSGLVMKSGFNNIVSIGKDFVKRFRSIMIPFLSFGLSLAIFLGITWTNLFTTHMKLGYWYLFVLMEFYLLNYLFSIFSNRTGNKWWTDALFGMCVAVCLIVLYRLMPENVWHLLSFHKVAEHYPYFFLGAFIHKHKLADKVFRNDYIFGFALLFMLFRLLFPHVEFYRRGMIQALSMIVLIVSLLYRNESCNNVFLRQIQHLGFSSLDIYVIHGFVFAMSNICFLRLFLDSQYYSVLGEITIGLIITLPIAYISMWIGKMLRENRLLQKLIFNK